MTDHLAISNGRGYWRVDLVAGDGSIVSTRALPASLGLAFTSLPAFELNESNVWVAALPTQGDRPA